MLPINKILIGACGAVALALMWLWMSNARLRAEVAEARTTATACRMANERFTAHAQRQNEAIVQMKSEAENRVAAAVAKAKKAAKPFYAAAESLRKEKLEGDACLAAEVLLNAYLGEQQ
jgi:hypothetical protein